MLDRVEYLRADGIPLDETLVQSGRRLRPVFMTSLAAALGMLPLAYGIGSGADMLRPLAIAVMGALAISVLLALVATPAVFYLLTRHFSHLHPTVTPRFSPLPSADAASVAKQAAGLPLDPPTGPEVDGAVRPGVTEDANDKPEKRATTNSSMASP